MKNAHKTLIIGLFSVAPIALVGQSAHKWSREADAAYRQQDYQTAEAQYRKAQQNGGGSKAQFNSGNAVFMQKRYAEAEKIYAETAEKTTDNALKAHALYNKGNAQFWQKNYSGAVEAYKQALRLHPHDAEAKQNLALAMRYLKKEAEEKAKQQAQKNDQNNPEKQPPTTDKNKSQGEEKPTIAQNQLQKNRENAKEMLKIMDEEERKVQARLKKDKGQAQPNKSGKDW